MEKIKIKFESTYNGHSIKKNGTIDLSFVAPYSQITNTVNLLQLINCNITLKVKIRMQVYNLGVFYLKELKIDREGESTIKFNSELDSVNLDSFNYLAEPELIILVSASGSVEPEQVSDEG